MLDLDCGCSTVWIVDCGYWLSIEIEIGCWIVEQCKLRFPIMAAAACLLCCMLGIEGKPDSSDGKSLEPMGGHGLQAMSIGFMIDDETPMIWRGPMVTQALEQLLRDTR